ncbi:MAG: hypothetical protein JRD05_13395 [Deltaproteobacteria bacterium]|nr:hypothetical protein [Deltaproteobacteria bacterium]
MKLSEIKDVLKAEVLAGEDQLDKTIGGSSCRRRSTRQNHSRRGWC